MGFRRYLFFFCGQLGMMGLARFFFQWIVKFPQGTSPGPEDDIFTAAAIGGLFLGFRIFDGVTDPLAGMLSDAWVRKGRRRRTLLWFSFLLPSIGLVLIFAPDTTMTATVRWGLVATGMFVFFVGYTFYAIPYWSLIDDYSATDDEGRRRVFSNLLGAGMLVATAVGFVVSGDLIDAYGFRNAALFFAAPAALLMILPAWACPAAGERRRQAAPEGQGTGSSPFGDFLSAFRHRRFVAVLVIFAGSQMSFSVMTAASPFIAERLLGGTMADVKWILGPFLLTAIPCFVVVPWLSRRFGWQSCVVAASLLLGVVYTGTALLGAAVLGSAWTTAGALFALGGPMAAVLLGLEAEAITACARQRDAEVTSIYFGVYNLVVKAMNGVAIFLTGLLSDAGAARWMGPMAGTMLAAGVVGYFLLRPVRDLRSSEVNGADRDVRESKIENRDSPGAVS